MSQRRWKVRAVIEEAAVEVAFLFTNVDVKSEVNRVLKALAAEDDPRSPALSSDLDVLELDSAPGWFRVKVARYGIRMIFRVLIVRKKKFLTIKRDEPLPAHEPGDQCYIEVMQAGYRKDVYGKELSRRYWRYREDDD